MSTSEDDGEGGSSGQREKPSCDTGPAIDQPVSGSSGTSMCPQNVPELG